MALARYPKLDDASVVQQVAGRIGEEEPREFFIRRFSEGVARIAAAFYPKPVIVRTSDFKTNEFARLLGGKHRGYFDESGGLIYHGPLSNSTTCSQVSVNSSAVYLTRRVERHTPTHMSDQIPH